MGSVDEVDGGSCDSGDDAEIAVQWEASMKLTVAALRRGRQQRGWRRDDDDDGYDRGF